MSKDLEVLTRNDLEQLLQDHTDRVVKSVEDIRTELKADIADVKSDVADINGRFDRLERNTHDDITVLFQEIYKIKKHIGIEVGESQ